MARIDDLMGEISEAALKARLQWEIAELKKDKKFGLVFEHHLPELVPMFGVPVRRGARVAERLGDISHTYLVERVQNKVARCLPEAGGRCLNFLRSTSLSSNASVSRYFQRSIQLNQSFEEALRPTTSSSRPTTIM